MGALSVFETALSVWGTLLLTFGLAVTIMNTIRWWSERRLLRELAEELFQGRVATPEDLLRLKQYLSCAIYPNVDRLNEPRPLLRYSAEEILHNRFGFCGENARVSILLLLLGGVRANRIYMEGKNWGHVAVEHFWQGRWCLFDAHNDPCTILPDASIGAVSSESFEAFPQRRENPWQRVYRVKLFHRIPMLRALEQMRLPRVIVQTFESPFLLKALVGLSVASVGYLFLS